jgi:hypothetical protein
MKGARRAAAIVFAMILASSVFGGTGAWALDPEGPAGSAEELAGIRVRIQGDSSWIPMNGLHDIPVTAHSSEDLGFPDRYDGKQPTVLDALVAAHVDYYGDVKYAAEYLAFDRDGNATMLLGEPSEGFVFFVDGKRPYREYLDEKTGKTVREDIPAAACVITSRATIDFYLYRDKARTDLCVMAGTYEGTQREPDAWKPIDHISLRKDETFDLFLRACPFERFGYASDGLGEPEQMAASKPLEGAEVVLHWVLSADGEQIDNPEYPIGGGEVDLSLTDADGRVTIDPSLFYDELNGWYDELDAPLDDFLITIRSGGGKTPPLCSPFIRLSFVTDDDGGGTGEPGDKPGGGDEPGDDGGGEVSLPTREELAALINRVAAYQLWELDFTNAWYRKDGQAAVSLSRFDGLVTSGERWAYYDSQEASIRAALQKDDDRPFANAEPAALAALILSLTATGADLQYEADFDFADPEHQAAWSLFDAFADLDWVTGKGESPMSAAQALLALDSGGWTDGAYAIPDLPAGSAAAQASRENIIDFLLDSQIAESGWGRDGDFGRDTPDFEATATVLAALAPYYGGRRQDGDYVGIRQAVHEALAYLSSEQDAKTAGFGNTVCNARVMIALCALGEPLDNKDFVKNGRTTWDALLDAYVETEAGGAFKGDRADTGPARDATDWGQSAFVALYRFLGEAPAFYDMEDRGKLRRTHANDPGDANGNGVPDADEGDGREDGGSGSGEDGEGGDSSGSGDDTGDDTEGGGDNATGNPDDSSGEGSVGEIPSGGFVLIPDTQTPQNPRADTSDTGAPTGATRFGGVRSNSAARSTADSPTGADDSIATPLTSMDEPATPTASGTQAGDSLLDAARGRSDGGNPFTALLVGVALCAVLTAAISLGFRYSSRSGRTPRASRASQARMP